MTNKELNDRPSSFVTELKILKGTNYKPNTLYEIIASIQHHLRTNGKFISLRDDADFSDLCVVLDAKMKELSKLGLGINKKTGFLYQQNIIIEQGNILWGRNILGPPKKKPRYSDQPSVSHTCKCPEVSVCVQKDARVTINVKFNSECLKIYCAYAHGEFLCF